MFESTRARVAHTDKQTVLWCCLLSLLRLPLFSPFVFTSLPSSLSPFFLNIKQARKKPQQIPIRFSWSCNIWSVFHNTILRWLDFVCLLMCVWICIYFCLFAHNFSIKAKFIVEWGKNTETRVNVFWPYRLLHTYTEGYDTIRTTQWNLYMEHIETVYLSRLRRHKNVSDLFNRQIGWWYCMQYLQMPDEISISLEYPKFEAALKNYDIPYLDKNSIYLYGIYDVVWWL